MIFKGIMLYIFVGNFMLNPNLKSAFILLKIKEVIAKNLFKNLFLKFFFFKVFDAFLSLNSFNFHFLRALFRFEFSIKFLRKWCIIR